MNVLAIYSSFSPESWYQLAIIEKHKTQTHEKKSKTKTQKHGAKSTQSATNR